MLFFTSLVATALAVTGIQATPTGSIAKRATIPCDGETKFTLRLTRPVIDGEPRMLRTNPFAAGGPSARPLALVDRDFHAEVFQLAAGTCALVNSAGAYASVRDGSIVFSQPGIGSGSSAAASSGPSYLRCQFVGNYVGDSQFDLKCAPGHGGPSVNFYNVDGKIKTSIGWFDKYPISFITGRKLPRPIQCDGKKFAIGFNGGTPCSIYTESAYSDATRAYFRAMKDGAADEFVTRDPTRLLTSDLMYNATNWERMEFSLEPMTCRLRHGSAYVLRDPSTKELVISPNGQGGQFLDCKVAPNNILDCATELAANEDEIQSVIQVQQARKSLVTYLGKYLAFIEPSKDREVQEKSVELIGLSPIAYALCALNHFICVD